MISTENIKKHLANQFHLPDEQIESMMPSFLSTLGEHMQTLENAHGANDLVLLGKAGHTIKGAFLNLGLDDCAQIALDIERSGKAGDSNVDYRQKIDTLYQLLQPVLS